MIQADNRARALSDLGSAASNQNIAYAGAGAGALGLVGGGVAAVVVVPEFHSHFGQLGALDGFAREE